MSSPRPARVHHIVGLVLLAAATLATVLHLWDRLGVYDEGLLLTDSRMVLRGAIPYRDFYTNYPSGIFLLVAWTWKIFGDHALLARFLGLIFHFTIAGFVGRLSGRVAGRAFLPWPAAMVLAFLLVTGAAPFAYLAAVALALAFVELALCVFDHPTTARSLGAGLALGATSAFRHDLFVYLCCLFGLVAIFATFAVVRRRGAPTRTLAHHGAWFVVGVTVPVASIWIPTFAFAPLRQIADDLYFDQVRYVLPARVMPFPPLFPDCFATSHAAAVILVLSAPLLAIVASRLVDEQRARRAMVFIGVLAIVLLPQSLGRSDLHHLVYGIGPAIILIGGMLERLARARSRRLSWASLIPLAWLSLLTTPLFSDGVALASLTDRDVSLWKALPMEHADARREVLAFIAAHTAPGDPIFVGLTDHRRVTIDEMDLYYLADRPGAVRRMQFDPNVVTRAEVQVGMIGELEQKQPNVAVLSAEGYFDEPNLSRVMGSGLLDAYLRSHYSVAESIGPYTLMLRRAE